MGVKNASASFQNLRTCITEGLPNCTVYTDDVVLFANTLEQPMLYMEQFFERLEKVGLVINLQNSEIGKASITYLEHVVGQGKVQARVS